MDISEPLIDIDEPLDARVQMQALQCATSLYVVGVSGVSEGASIGRGLNETTAGYDRGRIKSTPVHVGLKNVLTLGACNAVFQRTSKTLVQMAGNTTYTLGCSAPAAARCDYSSISVKRLQPTVLVPECLKQSACNISYLGQLGGGFEG